MINFSAENFKKIAGENIEIFPTPVIEKSPGRSPVKKKLDDLEIENVDNLQNKTPKDVNARAASKKETSPF